MRSPRASRKPLVVMAVVLPLIAGGCSKPTLAAKIDDLLRAGRAVEAQQKLATELPDLIREERFSQADDVARVLESRLPSLSEPEASSLRQRTLSGYLHGISNNLGEAPLGDVCESAVNGAPYSSNSLEAFLRESERRQSLSAFCKILGVAF